MSKDWVESKYIMEDPSGPCNFTTVTYDSNVYGVGSDNSYMLGVFFNTDGTKMFLGGQDAGELNQYDLSTAWDLNSITGPASTYEFGVLKLKSFSFSNDGLVLYTMQHSTLITQWDLSAAWDISSPVSNGSKGLSGVGHSAAVQVFYIKPDGSALYSVRNGSGNVSTDGIVQYSMTGGDITTLSEVAQVPIYPQLDDTVFGVTLSNDGSQMYVYGDAEDAVGIQSRIVQYELLTPWDITSYYYNGLWWNDRESDNDSAGDMFIKSDCTKFFMIHSGNGAVGRYTFDT